ncbi:alpha/beta hydrolase (plasmid) [Skermanella sp. TT6]|uniref:Alpha/beta hydrolase n=1 Tax=Skermanella cutis TaxID=2775420 RepID=A0ABX7BGD7_9PROT|nr:alpha/beta hydrolase [Skermanella sp. TT6]QQP93143.1 alpha/beta hydrolase [Skermanella sp. TT6]
MSMRRYRALGGAFLSLWISNVPLSASAQKMSSVEVNGVQVPYLEQGSGETVVFVHGTLSDLRAWAPISSKIAEKNRFIAYTQRYSGTEPWTDDGKDFSVATHADELVGLISSLGTGPVHLVGWSYGGTVATVAAVKNPSLVRSLVLYEPPLSTMMAPDAPETKKMVTERTELFSPVVQAAKAGDHVGASRMLVDRIFQIPPGGFDNKPEHLKTMWMDNARMIKLAFTAPPAPPITCDMLKNFKPPTLLLAGEETKAFFPIVIQAYQACMPNAELKVLRGVDHGGPVQDPAGFTAAVLGFLQKR